MNKRVVFTGGHITPAIAVMQELQSDLDIHLIGRKFAFTQAKQRMSFEYDAMRELNIPFHPLSTPRTPDSLPEYWSFPFSFIKAIYQSYQILRFLDPDLVVSFGGYVSFPVIQACVMLSIPYCIHDQTVRIGKGNRFNSVGADAIFISWPESRSDFPQFVQKKIQYIGNPIRSSIFTKKVGSIIQILKNNKLPILYITGGSTGAHAINVIISNALPELLTHYSVIHQCGDSQYDDYALLERRVSQLPNELQKRYILKKYVPYDEIGSVLQHSAILVGRSGANTVCEVGTVGIPALFIPLPYAESNEQLLLAKKLTNHNAAIILEQQGLTTKSLLQALHQMNTSYEQYKRNASSVQKTQEFSIHTKAASSFARYIRNSCNK